MTKVAAIAGAVFLELYFFLLNGVLAALFPTAIAITLYVHRLARKRRSTQAPAYWYGLIVILGIVVIAFGLWPTADSIATCSVLPFTSKIPPYDAATPAPLDAQQGFVADMERQLHEVLSRSQAVRDRAAGMSAIAKRLLAEERISSPELANAISALDAALQEHVQSDAAIMRERMEAVQTFVQQKREESLRLTSQLEREEFRNTLELQLTGNQTLDPIFTRLRTLEDVLESTLKADTNVGTRFIIDAAHEPTIAYTEEISVSTAGGRVTQIDLRELQSAADVQKSYRREFQISYRGGAPEPLETLYFTPDDQDFVILHRTIEEVATANACEKHRLWPMRQLFIRWPQTLPATIYVTTERTTETGSQQFTTRHVLNRTNPIAEVRLPPYSFFMADYRFAATEGLGYQQLDGGSTFTPEGFRRMRPILLQLIPDSGLLRNSWVQGYKHYLLVTNLVASVVVMLLSALFGLAFMPKKKA